MQLASAVFGMFCVFSVFVFVVLIRVVFVTMFDVLVFIRCEPAQQPCAIAVCCFLNVAASLGISCLFIYFLLIFGTDCLLAHELFFQVMGINFSCILDCKICQFLGLGFGVCNFQYIYFFTLACQILYMY